MHTNEQLVALLSERKWHISFAESCTAGLAVAHLADVAGASGVLDVSFVTYANEAKQAYAGVRAETLAAHGAVSEAVAREMAAGVAKESGAEVGVGISGIAGPGGGTPEKPVGTVCFGFSVNGTVSSATCHFEGLDRTGVREAAVKYAHRALVMLIQDAK
jgi:PncC family amidohydrolase